MIKLLEISAIIVALNSTLAIAGERKGKAVYEVTKENGMRLTPEALKNIEIQTSVLQKSGIVKIPKDALVLFQENTGVYRLRDGWFKLVRVKIQAKKETFLDVQSSELQSGDEIVVHGGDLLRVSELDALGGGE